MTGHPYDGGALRMGATIDGETINWTDDNIYIALMKLAYEQDVTDTYWSDIAAYEVDATGDYVKNGASTLNKLTTANATKHCYIESTLYTPFRYVVYSANADETPAYSIHWGNTAVTFSGTNEIGAAVIYKKTTGATSTWPLICCISELTERTAYGEKFYIMFDEIVAAAHTTLGIYNRQLL
jgi:hypothetical protein